ncbi:hypothetical protein O6H91_16G041800 [Diphasiastrum complanatum]|uniref:Uncharacterized protein n=1 Tax=Diphasiastrum complanatum TaxID=34168 RepID=A0ACC2BBQ5_DIPCM|nr:hypothetical protein O6H91_16G041800 [Diphasiastrum complanatum]
MSLACHATESSRMPDTWRTYSVSSHSDDEGRCGVIVNCFFKKSSVPTHATENFNAANSRQRVVPIPNGNATSSPRLTRCHALRRDIFRDWNFEEMADEGRQLCLNLSIRA